MVPWERLELSRREAQVPKTCVSTIPPPGLSGADGENRTPNLLITNQLPYHSATSA